MRTRLFWWILLLLVAVGLIAAGGPLAEQLVGAMRDVAGGADTVLEKAALVVAAGAFTFLTVFLPLPAEASAFLNGSLFAPSFAFPFTWVLAMLGAAASYEIGRHYGRSPATALVGEARMTRVERILEDAGWPLLLALRLSPVMAFTAINWASGILALSRPVYYWTTALGLIPGTYIFTVVPELALGGASANGYFLLAVAAVILLVSVAVARIITRKNT